MIKFFLILTTLITIYPNLSCAGPAVIYNGNSVKALKQNLNLNDSASVLTGTSDPTSVAQNAPQGSLYLMTGGSGGRLFEKTDAGSSTNWSEFTAAPKVLVNSNIAVATSVAANALTIALKTQAGSDASANSPISIPFRNSTSATGTYNIRTVTSALSVVIPSGAVMGHSNNIQGFLYVYAIDNAGTVELAVTGDRIMEEGAVATTVAMSTGSDDGYQIFSTTQRTNVPIKMIAMLKSTQTTAGTWASNVTQISPYNMPNSFRVSQMIVGIGTRVTATPAALGEYRTYTQNANTDTGSDNAPTTAASVGDGMHLWCVPRNTGGTSGQPNRMEIFVGFNKQIVWEQYANSGRSGWINTAFRIRSVDLTGNPNNTLGVSREYDPALGVVVIDTIVPAKTDNYACGVTTVTGGGAGNAAFGELYVDLVVSDRPTTFK